MSIIIRLQNLPWAADSMDIRRFFVGLSIPEGGVHIVGGEMGDAFIAFSTDEDARLAMEKDGGKIHEMQIKLLLSSRAEMMRVIEKARQLNLAMQAQAVPIPQPIVLPVQQQSPARSTPPMVESDRRRGQEDRRRSPSPHRRNRDKSPSRDRRRSPDRRSSKRDRSRSPTRYPRNNTRDTDRRDRFERLSRRDDRRYDDSSRHRDDRRRESSQEKKKYSEADNRRAPPAEPVRETSNQGYIQDPATTPTTTAYSYNSDNLKDLPAPFYTQATTEKASVLQASDLLAATKSASLAQVSSPYMQQQMTYSGTSYSQQVPASKNTVSNTAPEQKPTRRSRFEPEVVPTQVLPFFTTTSAVTKLPEDKPLQETSYTSKPLSLEYCSSDTNAWASQNVASEGVNWSVTLLSNLETPASTNADYIQVVPMDIEQSPPQTPIETFNQSKQYLSQILSQSLVTSQMPVTSNDMSLQNYLTPRNNDGASMNIDMSPRNSDMSPRISGMPSRNTDMPPRNTDMPPRSSETTSRSNDMPPRSSDMSVRNSNISSRADMTTSNIGVREMPKKDFSPRKDNRFKGPQSLTVEITGIPPDLKIAEVQAMFKDIPVHSSSIKIYGNNQRAEKAFVRFSSFGEVQEATSGKPRFVRNFRCKIVPCSAESSPNKGKFRPKPKPREEDHVVQLRGLPFSCKAGDIDHFFDGLKITDMFLEYDSEGKAIGIAFVEFATNEDFRAALAMNGKMIGHRYITISVASKDFISYHRGEEFRPQGPPQNHKFKPRLDSPKFKDIPPKSTAHPPSRQVNFCLSLAGLPKSTVNLDIVHFFSDVGVIVRAVHLLLDADKTPSGEAFVEIASQREVDDALGHNGKPLDGNRISVLQIPFNEMLNILEGPPTLPPPPRTISFLGPPAENSRRTLMPKPPAETFFDEHHPDYHDESRHHFNQSENELPPGNRPPYFHHNQEGDFPPANRHPNARPSRPNFPPDELRRGPREFDRHRPEFRPRNERFRSDFPRGDRPPRFESRIRGVRPRMERPMRPPFEQRIRGAFPRSNGPDRGPAAGFGAPGCVVAIDNLHFRAGLEELLEFFNGYMLTKDSVIRKFNENGQPTGEARVAFQNPRDAERVVKELNHKTIMGRAVSLFLL